MSDTSCGRCGSADTFLAPAGRPRKDGTRKLIRHCRPCRSTSARERHGQLRDQVIAVYGGPECACCGNVDRPEIDHVNGGGYAERKGTRYYQLLKWLVAELRPGFQILCVACNASKGTGDRCLIPEHRQYQTNLRMRT